VKRQATATSRATQTLEALLKSVFLRFKRSPLVYGHGTTNAWDEAVWIVLHALKLPLHPLNIHLHRKISAAERRRIEVLVAARIRARTPAAYLMHEAWLGDFRFYIDDRVLVPRSFIAELLRENLAPWVNRATLIKHALDLGTGSGCLAILMAKTFRDARIDAADVSGSALDVARRNVTAYRLKKRIRLLQSDMFLALEAKRYDLIISNPPYVDAATMRRLPPEYRCEPSLALAGGRDGFDFVRILLENAAEHLSSRGLLIVEIGHRRKKLEAAFPNLPFIWPQTSAGDDCVFILERRHLDLAVPKAR
jgi:ribosomal protein L3 glutamine methyltransferase